MISSKCRNVPNTLSGLRGRARGIGIAINFKLQNFPNLFVVTDMNNTSF